jgi:hypothetical protein
VSYYDLRTLPLERIPDVLSILGAGATLLEEPAKHSVINLRPLRRPFHNTAMNVIHIAAGRF